MQVFVNKILYVFFWTIRVSNTVFSGQDNHDEERVDVVIVLKVMGLTSIYIWGAG